MSIRTYYLRKKYWLQDYLSGGKMWKAFSEIMRIMNAQKKGDFATMRRIRQAHLRQLLEFAAANVPFYRPFNPANLSSFPVITKEKVRSNYQLFLTPEDKIPGQVGKVHIQHTSGSSGMPFEVHQDTNCRIRRLAAIKAENEVVGFHSFDALMHLRNIREHWNWDEEFLYRPDLNIYYVDNGNMTAERLQNILDLINEKKIGFIRGYMTTLETITRYAAEHHIELKHSPCFISGGEHMLEGFRNRVVNELHCHIVNQYANEESGVLGSSPMDEDGSTIVLNNGNCVVEILKQESDEPAGKGEIGRIVITDFSNYAMPLIRYDTGDLAVAGDRADDGTILSLSNLVGRKTDMICKVTGEEIDFLNSRTANFNSLILKRWQFIQTGRCSYVMNMVLEHPDEEFCAALRQDIEQILGGGDIQINCMDELPVLPSGKRKLIDNPWKRQRGER